MGFWGARQSVASLAKCFSIPAHTGRPQPLAGSHPFVAGKPLSHDVFVFPDVTSKNASPGYFSIVDQSRGPRKPSGGRPLLRRRSTTREKMPAIVGDDWLVPSDEMHAMSGYARPDALNDDAFGSPCVFFKYAGTLVF